MDNIYIKLFILMCMIFLHIFDDFHLQGILAQYKQKSFWENHPIGKEEMYRYDYVISLLIHSFSWSFMILLPTVIFLNFQINGMYFIILFSNLIIHALIDNLKANLLKINLVTDQILHLVQILMAWELLIL